MYLNTPHAECLGICWSECKTTNPFAVLCVGHFLKRQVMWYFTFLNNDAWFEGFLSLATVSCLLNGVSLREGLPLLPKRFEHLNGSESWHIPKKWRFKRIKVESTHETNKSIWGPKSPVTLFGDLEQLQIFHGRACLAHHETMPIPVERMDFLNPIPVTLMLHQHCQFRT